MSSIVPISGQGITAPTPQNTPLNQAPIATAGLSRPTVPDITEDNEQESDDGEDMAPDLSQAQAHLLGMVQGRLAGLIGKSSGYIENLPLPVKLSVEGLKGLQVKQDELQAQLKRKITALEKEYLELTKPLYERRNAIISGKEAATAEEIEAGTEYSVNDDPKYEPLPKDTPPSATAIPEFWLTALRNHIHLSELITDRDEAALKHIINIHFEYLDDSPESEHGGKTGFKLFFTFSPNEFFENEVLTKTYLYQQELGYNGDFIYGRAIGTEIKWKEDKDLTKEFEIKKQRNRNTNRTRLVRKARPTESFFNFFTPPLPLDDANLEELDEEEADEAEEKLELDYQLGEDFKDKIIPRAIDYFTGKAVEYEMMDGADFEDSEEDDDDDGDDDDDVSDDEEEPSRRRGPPKGAVNPEECKQQ
ncbi:Putative nucleosome assembly protein C2D10.11C [Leucoagaricus sp. SymC.cos]|nr:Putative nucleosome assembly protein C2D10.11C [Leucoagaricus sp. SymC.cos]